MNASVVSLREITDENREAVVALRIAESQEGVVSSVADSLLEARRPRKGTPGIGPSTPTTRRLGS